jgi:general secretion pathway protein E
MTRCELRTKTSAGVSPESVCELLLIDDPIRSLIHDKAAGPELLKVGRAAVMRTLREDAERWLAAGVTSLEEVIHVTGE